MTTPVRRWLALVTLLLGVTALASVPTGPAWAAPDDSSTIDHEGANPTLRDVLEAASKGYLDAQMALETTRKRHLELTRQLQEAEARLPALTQEVNEIASAVYRRPPLGTASVLLDNSSPESLLTATMTMDSIFRHRDRQIRELSQTRRRATEAKSAIDAELAKQQTQVDALAKKKLAAERSLAAAGGKATGGFVSATSPLAKPAQRAANGSWPPESCTVDDPTTTGCVTPRMLHALQQARAAGFGRFAGCFRTGDRYEHPKGRACDFAASERGFGGAAVGADRTYGNNLAAFFVRNANALGVLYVIWYRQIWMPATGWRAYSGGGGPAGEHTNHVHLSVY